MGHVRRLRSIVPVALVLVLTGCSEFRQVGIQGTLEQPVIRVTKTGSSHPLTACVDWVVVAERFDQKRMLWRIRSIDGKCVELDSLTYGLAPEGFVTDTPAQPFQADVEYDLGGHGWTKGWLPSVPWYGGGQVTFQAGQWQALPG